jgi:hypothetical protein
MGCSDLLHGSRLRRRTHHGCDRAPVPQGTLLCRVMGRRGRRRHRRGQSGTKGHVALPGVGLLSDVNCVVDLPLISRCELIMEHLRRGIL